MLLSAEIRWFWKTEAPVSLHDWFMDAKTNTCKPGGGPPPREDIYLVDRSQSELGIKIRGKKGGPAAPAVPAPVLNDIEVKGLIAVNWGVLTTGPLAGPVEIWCKWPFSPVDLGSTARLVVKKTRWLRKFDTTGPYPVELPLGEDEKPIDDSRRECLPALGCNIELTEVVLPNSDTWWSFGLEAFGDLGTVEDNLREVAKTLSERGISSDPCSGLLLCYPRWINQYALGPIAQIRKTVP